MCTTLNSFLGNHATNNNDKKSNFRKNGTPNHNTISIPVKSAQYHRKFLQTNLTNRMSIHPYIRIKRVD
jgi:hypothetical protein